MRFTSLKITHFRSFRESPILELGAVNVLIGAINAGKSSVLKALSLVQAGLSAMPADVRVGFDHARIEIGLVDALGVANWGDIQTGMLEIDLSAPPARNTLSTNINIRRGDSVNGGVPQLPGLAPDHFMEEVRQDLAMRCWLAQPCST